MESEPCPKPNPFQALLHSRKFWLAILALVQTVLFQFVPNFPDGVWVAIDAVLAIVIAAIAYEDVGNAKASAAYDAAVANGQGSYDFTELTALLTTLLESLSATQLVQKGGTVSAAAGKLPPKKQATPTPTDASTT